MKIFGKQILGLILVVVMVMTIFFTFANNAYADVSYVGDTHWLQPGGVTILVKYEFSNPSSIGTNKITISITNENTKFNVKKSITPKVSPGEIRFENIYLDYGAHEIKVFSTDTEDYLNYNVIQNKGFSEGEYNDTHITADFINLGNEYLGDLSSSSDIDYFRKNFFAHEVGNLEVHISHPAKPGSGKYMDYEILDSSQNKINGQVIRNDQEKTIIYHDNVPVHQYYFVLKNGEGPYTFKVIKSNVKSPGRGYIKTVKGKKKSIYFTWFKIKSNTFQLRYRIKGKSKWKYKNVKFNKKRYTLKKLKSNKRYEIQMRPYKIVNGHKYYGSWGYKRNAKTK